MKQEILSCLLLASLVTASVCGTTTFAAEKKTPTEMSVIDMIADYGENPQTLVINETGVYENGKLTTFSKATGISKFKSLCIHRTGTEKSYLENQGYVCTEDADGTITAENAYQSRRLYVNAVNLDDYCNAVAKNESGGVTLLQFASEKDTKEAENQLSERGYHVITDSIISDNGSWTLDSSYTYTTDILNQYGSTASATVGGSTATLKHAPELLGLTQGARAIVDAQSAAEINQIGVAVVDSGVDTSHPIFSGRVLGGYNVVANSSATNDAYGHGTLIASIIANNTPSNVKIMPIKITDDNGNFTASRMAAALQYIVNNSNSINVVNMSLSACTLNASQMDMLTSYINPYIDTLYSRGIKIITSAGNTNSSYPSMTADDSYPANYSKTTAVSALAYNNGWTSYNHSLTGTSVDLCAPGKYIRGVQASSMNMVCMNDNGGSGEYLSYRDGTCSMSGTSQATAFITAAYAQVLSYNPYLSSSEQDSIMKKLATKSAVGGTDGTRDNVYGYGYPDMSGYVYATGVYKSDSNGYAGLVTDFDVVIDNPTSTVTLVKYTGSGSNVTVSDSYTINGHQYKTQLGKSSATSGPFANNTTIQTATLGSGVQAKDGDASYLFYGCSNLSAINRIPENATDISYLCYGCGKLLQIPTVPSSVTKMNYAFANCTGATGTSSILSPGVSSASGAYDGDKVAITVPDGSVTYNTLKGLLSGWPQITINGSSGTSGSSGNTSETGNKDETTSNKKNTSAELADWEYTVNFADGTITLTKYKGSSSTVTIANTYTVDGKSYKTVLGKSTATTGPFANNKTVRIVLLGDGVTVADNDASYLFYNCSALESINRIPAGAKRIDYICYGCSSLKILPSVPDSVTLMDHAFENCTSATGQSVIASPNVTSATDAYKGTSVTLMTLQDSATYRLITDLTGKWPGVTIASGSQSAIQDATKENTVYTVTFHYRNQTANRTTGELTKTVTVKYGDVVKAPSTKGITVKNYAFLGWYIVNSDGSLSKYVFTTPVTGDVEICAKWSSIKISKTSATVKKTASKKMKVTYKKLSNVTGYHIQYCRYKNFQNPGNVFVKSSTTLSKNISTLKSGKIYVRVRGYKKINGKKYYGSWSTIKSIKV